MKLAVWVVSLNFLHDFTLFVLDINQIRIISIFWHFSGHFHFHPTLEPKRVIDLKICRIQTKFILYNWALMLSYPGHAMFCPASLLSWATFITEPQSFKRKVLIQPLLEDTPFQVASHTALCPNFLDSIAVPVFAVWLNLTNTEYTRRGALSKTSLQLTICKCEAAKTSQAIAIITRLLDRG